MSAAKTPPLHICIRSTVDWSDEAAFRHQLSPDFAPKVNAWNATFRLPYHAFRRELKTIAQANLAQVKGAVVCPWEEVPDGALVAPVDDDDWFAPHLVEAIDATARTELLGMHWQQSVLEVPINSSHRLQLMLRRWIPGLRPRWLCATNNYVIRKGSVDPRCFTSHVAASHWFPQQPPDRIEVLPQRLSLHNRSLASITSLNFGRPSISPRRLRRRRRSYDRLYRRWRTVPADLAWCLPSLDRMEALMARLAERRC